MVSYKAKYLNYFSHGEQDWVCCEVCKGTGVDVHHIKSRSQGGSDDIENLIALCRKCHNHAHSDKVRYDKEYFQKHHDKFILWNS